MTMMAACYNLKRLVYFGVTGNTFLCNWKRVRGGYRIWLIDDDAIYTQGADFDECEFELSNRICIELGDTEAVIEYVRSLPSSVLPRKFSNPAMVSLGQNGGAKLLSSASDLVASGICPACHSMVGERTSALIRVANVTSGADSICVAGLSTAIYSEDLLESLGVRSIGGFEFREVRVDGRSSRKYLELIPRSRDLELNEVAIKAFWGSQWASRCEGCGRRGITSITKENRLIWFVSAAQIAALPNAVGILNSSLCVKAETWRRARKQRKMGFVMAAPIGVVSEFDIDENPPLKIIPGATKT